MKPIQNPPPPDIGPWSTSNEVAPVHEALGLLLSRGVFGIPDDERQHLEILLRNDRQERRYGDGTARVVDLFRSLFADTFGLTPGEIVDEPTAQALNTLLSQLGLLDDESGGWTEVVRALETQTQTLSAINAGTDQLASIDQKLAALDAQTQTLAAINAGTDRLAGIDAKIGTLAKTPALSYAYRGDTVRELHAQLSQIGVALPAQEQEEGIFGVATRDAVLQVQAKYDLAQTGVVDDATRNALLLAAGAMAHPRRVEGRIFLENGLPAANIRLQIVHKGFGDDATILGEVVETDERGFYALPYALDGAANLEVQAFAETGELIRLSTPKVNADRTQALNLVAPPAVKARSSEFTLMAADLSGLVGGDLSRLAQAREDDTRQDLSMAHQATGWDARLVATAAKAAQDSATTGIAHDALYGALRAGLPDDPDALAQVSPEAFAAALTRANDAGVVVLDGDQRAAAVGAFESFALQARRSLVVPGALSTPGDLLDRAPIAADHRATFERLALLHDGDAAGLWQEARDAAIPDDAIAALQLQGKLAYLTLNNAALVEALQPEIETQANLAALVDKDLYKQAPWRARLDALATEPDGTLNLAKLAALIPAAYAQPEVTARRDAYAEDLARKVRQAYPTQVVARRIENEELRLGAQQAELKAPVQAFLRNAAGKGFQLGRSPVDAFVAQNDDTLFAGIADQKEAALAGARLLARAYQMTPNDEAMTALLDLGFTSAHQVAAIPKASFVERYQGHFGSRKATELVWEKSSQITSVTFGLYAMAKQVDSTPPVLAISGAPARRSQAQKDLKSLLKDYPTMDSLFGALDFCECEHCHSVLSPAAYLVDLLRFVDPSKQEWELLVADWQNKRNGREYQAEWDTKPDQSPRLVAERKPYDALIERRPDLPHIPLTCENTNTALPYIDLVNEILEYYVAHTRLDALAAKDTGDATSAELLAEPHTVIPEAYAKLKAARYPLTLPFDLWLETVRRFCDHFETPLWQVLDAFRPSEELFAPAATPAPYYRADIFAESLGLSPDEVEIFTRADFAGWPVLYGYDANDATTAMAELASAKTLARRLGVSYKELAALIQTEFVNPKLAELTLLRKLGVSADDVFRYKQHPSRPPLAAEEEAEFEKRLTQATEKYQAMVPDFDARQRLDDAWNAQGLDHVPLLRDAEAGCSFEETTVLYTDGASVDALDLVKLTLFVRLWKRLGWTIDETDRALAAFLPDEIALSETTLGAALKTALVYIAHLKELEGLLSLGKNSRRKLLALWTGLPTTGATPLYAQLFLTRGILKDDAVFDHPLGQYLSAPGVALIDHLPALQAALQLTADEIGQILRDGNTGDEAGLKTATLSLANMSLLYRYGLLAKGLKLSIHDLISLKAVTGLDPFHALEPTGLAGLAQDYPLQQTIAFVRHAQSLAASGLTVADLDYLFRHRFDPAGRYRADSAAALAWSRSLAADLRAIAADLATPTTLDDLSDDALKQKLALVVAPDVVETFMGFWLDKTVYSAVRANVAPAGRLPAAPYSLPGVTVVYDETRQRQQVTHAGALTVDRRNALLAQIPVPAPGDPAGLAARQMFSQLLDEIVQESEVRFERFFEQHFDGLLAFDDFFGAAIAATREQKRLGILQVVMPYLRNKRTRQAIVQTLAAQTAADPALVEMAVTNPAFLALPDDLAVPLLDWFAGLGQVGLTGEQHASPDLSDDPRPLAENTRNVELTGGAGVNSARWRAYLEVPQNGAYRFYARLGEQGAAVALRFDGQVEPVLATTAERDGHEASAFVELKSGTLYSFTLEATNLQGGALALAVKGETTSKTTIDRFVTLPYRTVERANQAVTMLSKAAQLVQVLGLSAREVRHILANPQDFGNLHWRQLPVEPDDSNAASLFDGLVHVQQYTALKQAWAGGGEDLVGLLEQARATRPPDVQTLCGQIAFLTRRDPAVVAAVAAELRLSTPDQFASVATLTRLWRGLQIVATFGVSMESLRKWLTPAPDAAVASAMRGAIKARYEPETWQRVAQAIFDPLRQRQRDALVAYIMHVTPELDSVEKLFEYFLIDPGMEPVVQTSRIRLAISSVQTFIQRCFLNLEPHVHPSMLNAQHWAWMKRYRIWEANRKIFLFPENWLEPEWRDDKTHLYQELEGALLQGDVTNQLAEDALYVYLRKLEQLARLEIVTMYAEEQPPGPPVIHVVGRTYSQPALYFYRRYSHGMWTPWEPISTEIEGNHIVAAVWRGRLHLFWVTFMEKVEQAGPPSSEEPGALGSLPVKQLVAAAASTSAAAVARTLDMQLNWSEYTQGEWSTRASSGFGYTEGLSAPFDPRKVFLTVAKNADPTTGAESSLSITLYGLGNYPPVFVVTSKNNRPRKSVTMGIATTPFAMAGKRARFNAFEGSGALSITFVQSIVTTDGAKVSSPPAPQTILSQGNGFTLLPTSNHLTLPNAEFAPLISPVFYADQNTLTTFFVEPSLTETTVDRWEGYVITRPSQKPKWTDFIEKGPPIDVVVPPKYQREALKTPKGISQPDPIDKGALLAIKPSVDVLAQPGVAVQFGESLIAATGRVQDAASISRVVTRVGGNL